MRTLITNDDGIEAAGIKVLAEHFRSLGPVTVVAPLEQRSCAGHSLTFLSPLRIIRETHLPKTSEKFEYHEYVIGGTPSDCVMMAVYELMPELPELLISGINLGANVGYDVTYSATVGAAMEGVIHQIKSMAVSISGRHPVHLETAAVLAGRLASKILGNPDATTPEERPLQLPTDTFLSLNVPDIPLSELQGVRFTQQGVSVYQQRVEKFLDPWGNPCYWLCGEIPQGILTEQSDFYALHHNYASITPLHLDMTNYEALKQLQELNWKF